MEIEFRSLAEVEKNELIALMNHPLVRRQMPLLTEAFTARSLERFIEAKERLWTIHGYGPLAFFVAGRFAGWGGLQAEDGDADLAMVLHPDYWGLGKELFARIIKEAFCRMGLSSVTALLPPGRTRINGLLKLGFKKETEVLVGTHRFIKYRLDKSPC